MKSFSPKPWLAPQLVLVVGTYGPDGTPNAMNVAWGGVWDVRQIQLSLGKHATTDNLDRNPDFTVALANVETMTAADYVGIVSGKKVPDKVARTGWRVEQAPNVNAPVFTDFPITFECRISRKLDESETGYYVVADVLGILCGERYLADDGQPDIEKMNLITYDGVHHTYIRLGSSVGNAFSIGRSLI